MKYLKAIHCQIYGTALVAIVLCVPIGLSFYYIVGEFMHG